MYILPPSNALIASAKASLDSISRLFVGSSCEKMCENFKVSIELKTVPTL